MFKKIITSIIDCFNFIYDYFNEITDKKEQQKRAEQICAQIRYLYNVMHEITKELYEAFRGNNYPKLNTIRQPSQIRIVDYKATPNGYLFYFSLVKSEQDIIANTILADIKNYMTRDIYYTQKELLRIHGFDFMCMFHPYLFYGLYIMSVKDFGNSEILITVASNYLP